MDQTGSSGDGSVGALRRRDISEIESCCAIAYLELRGVFAMDGRQSKDPVLEYDENIATTYLDVTRRVRRRDVTKYIVTR